MMIEDLTWEPVTQIDPSLVVFYEDGPQPRDERGRFRQRKVVIIESEKTL